MPPHILDLPDEVLDICLSELLPAITNTITHWDNSVPEPCYLLGLLTLCKAFHRLALPWVWRRIMIGMSYEEPRIRLEFSSGRWKFLRDHPEVASHIRVFALCITGRTTQEYVAPLCAIVSLMTNLRILRFSVYDTPNLDLIYKLYITLLSRPDLHTLIIKGCFPTELIQNLSTLASLRRLDMQGRSGMECFLLERTQFLESLAISSETENGIPIPWTKMSIPWATLRELRVYDDGSTDMYDWYLILENHSSWKKSFPGVPSRLTELFITLLYPVITLAHIRLLTVFGPQLRRLCLAFLEEINQEILDHIVDGFPHLHELHLLSQTENRPQKISWRVEPTTMAESFGKLTMLKRLNLNYVDPVIRDEDEWPVSAVRDVVPLIGRACHSLEVLEFHHDFPGEQADCGWISFTILRNDNGEYESSLQTEGADWFHPLTSGWNLDNYSYI